MWTLNMTLMLLCVAAVCLCADTDGSKYVGCKSTSDCGPGRCCVFLNGRYPTTACDSHRRQGESCRPRGQPFSQALNYPGGATVQVTDVYQGLCPCDLGLSCNKAQCVKA
ncbi:astakine-like [Homalodisca vitripennis]|uniref:astakine-like n=1 Tax=Homalodisca vitripennis TaxID=197043 RepID=UPI001EEB4C9D|nr:astakine-like [Homalodisca vitripennis]